MVSKKNETLRGLIEGFIKEYYEEIIARHDSEESEELIDEVIDDYEMQTGTALRAVLYLKDNDITEDEALKSFCSLFGGVPCIDVSVEDLVGIGK